MWYHCVLFLWPRLLAIWYHRVSGLTKTTYYTISPCVLFDLDYLVHDITVCPLWPRPGYLPHSEPVESQKSWHSEQLVVPGVNGVWSASVGCLSNISNSAIRPLNGAYTAQTRDRVYLFFFFFFFFSPVSWSIIFILRSLFLSLCVNWKCNRLHYV